MKHILAITALLALALVGFAQKTFQGTIKYKLTYQNVPQEQMSMLPANQTSYYSDDFVRSDVDMGMGMSQRTINNVADQSSTIIMDVMGQKIYIEMSEEDTKELRAQMNADGAKPEIEVDPEATVDVAGYTCKKATISYAGNTTVVYYTEDLKAAGTTDPTYNELDGVVLMTEMSQNGIDIRMKAIEVNKEKLDKSTFAIPEGYEKMSLEEFKQAMGGMM